MNIEAVKKIGFFDERFTTLHYHEVDYFNRARKILGNRCHICKEDNDELGNIITSYTFSGFNEDETLHNYKNFEESRAYYEFTESDINKKEIDWYPFFGDGYENIRDTLLDVYKVRNWKENEEKKVKSNKKKMHGGFHCWKRK